MQLLAIDKGLTSFVIFNRIVWINFIGGKQGGEQNELNFCAIILTMRTYIGWSCKLKIAWTIAVKVFTHIQYRIERHYTALNQNIKIVHQISFFRSRPTFWNTMCKSVFIIEDRKSKLNKFLVIILFLQQKRYFWNFSRLIKFWYISVINNNKPK